MNLPPRRVERAAIFLDKDGTLIRDVPYNVDVRRIQVYPEAPAALEGFAALGYSLIVVSNQPGIAHGYFDTAAMARVEEALHNMLSEYGIVLDAFLYCPHHPNGEIAAYAVDCDCRKPRAGLLRRAARRHAIDLSSSWMIGDILNDVEAGNRAGCRTILVDRGNETEWVAGQFRQPDTVVSDLSGALRHVKECFEVQDHERTGQVK